MDRLQGLLVDAGPHDVKHADATGALVGARRVLDRDLPQVGEPALPLVVHVTGGAGQIAAPARLCSSRGLPVAALTVTLRDPDDLAGNARRVVAAVDAARSTGDLADDVAVRVALPAEPPGHGWSGAADEVAAAELDLAIPLALDGRHVPATWLAQWLDAMLDRETAYAALGGGPARRGPTGHGVLDLLAATAALWDGGTVEDAARILDTSPASYDALATGRRWCRAVEVPDPAATVAEIRAALA